LIVIAAISFMIAAVTMALIGSSFSGDKPRLLMSGLAGFFLIMGIVPGTFLSSQGVLERAMWAAAGGAAAGVCYQILFSGGPDWIMTPVGAMGGMALGGLAFFLSYLRYEWRHSHRD
jgi:hypothetical protein